MVLKLQKQDDRD